MNLLSKETLIGAASLGAGAVAAKVVQEKVLKAAFNPVAIIRDNENVQNLITLGFGIFTPVLVKGPIGKGLGAGMIAVSVAGLVTPLLKSANLITGTDGYSDNVFMGEVESSGVLMGASDMFTSATNDLTEGNGGEMDF
jgi:hypothetical protein